LTDVLMVMLVVACAATDLRRRLILNAFTYPAMLAGVLLNLIHGWRPGASAVAGLVVGLAAFWPLYRAGGMGMGDLKLFAAIGSLKGVVFLCSAMIDSALAGGVLALGLTVVRGNLAVTLRRTARVPATVAAALFGSRRSPAPPADSSDAVPYGVAICAGTLMALWFMWPW
jgi:prepilin peptidase CpaA